MKKEEIVSKLQCLTPEELVDLQCQLSRVIYAKARVDALESLEKSLKEPKIILNKE